MTATDKRNYGYDLMAEASNGDKVLIEVKGQSHDQDVELTANELEAADTYRDSFYLCVVSDIPNHPSLHMVRNPADPKVGERNKVTISVNTWKAAKWP